MKHVMTLFLLLPCAVRATAVEDTSSDSSFEDRYAWSGNPSANQPLALAGVAEQPRSDDHLTEQAQTTTHWVDRLPVTQRQVTHIEIDINWITREVAVTTNVPVNTLIPVDSKPKSVMAKLMHFMRKVTSCK